MDDTFQSIQFWGNPDDYKLSDDARDIINDAIFRENLKNMYYFYSILTHDYKVGVLRRHFENVVDVMGYCQSISTAYFDIFYGNVCLEVTIFPKKEIFEKIGHDSEEFRIWEILALQKDIAKNKNSSKLIKSLEEVFDFRDFTIKLKKGSNWINYAKYLQEITGIQYHYKIRKQEFELNERDKEKKLQKLNILIIASIFISLMSFFLTPIYDNSIPKEPSAYNNVSAYNLAYKVILGNSYPEPLTVLLAAFFTYVFYLFANLTAKKASEESMFDKIISELKTISKSDDLVIYLIVVSSLILAIIALLLLYIL